MWNGKRFVASFVLGGIGGLCCDQIHVRFGVLSYPRPDLFGQPWWVAPNFGFGMILILTGALFFVPRSRARRPTLAGFAAGGACFVAAYFATGLFHASPIALTLALFLTWLPRIAARRDRGPAALYSVLLGAGGVVYESLLSAFGLFHYLEPHLGWVPMWLPFLYMHGAPVALDVALRLTPPPATSAP